MSQNTSNTNLESTFSGSLAPDSLAPDSLTPDPGPALAAPPSSSAGPAASPAQPSQPGSAPAQSTAIFLGIAGPVDTDQLQQHAAGMGDLFEGARLLLAFPGAELTRTPLGTHAELLTYPLPTTENSNSPWAQAAAAQVALLSLAAPEQPQAIVLLHPDLAAFTPGSLRQLASPVLARQAELVMAGYTQAPFDGLLNTAILAPLNRALYGRRVPFPLAPDFAVSPRLAARLAMSAPRSTGAPAIPVLWPATVAAGIDAQVQEARLDLHHPPAPGVELGTAMAQLTGSAFAEMETHAPLWQRVRAAPQPPVRSSGQPTGAAQLATTIDTAPMIQSFLLGSRSLQDVWGLVLPPITLLDLKRIAQLPADKFRIPDELWVRIIYDFALGYRLRTINRTHLLGALTPLYLGWVASFIHQAAIDPAFHADVRAEQLARAFEDGKPYLVRRWRWPDRFNP